MTLESFSQTEQIPLSPGKNSQGDSQQTPRKPHISVSAIKAFFRCGEYYRRKFVEREVMPPTMPLHKGSAVHYGAEINFKQKIQSFKDLPGNQIKEAAAAAFETRVKNEGYLLNAEEEGRGYRIVLGEAKDRAIKLTEIYTSEIAPAHQPVIAEQFQRIALSPSLDLLVKMDWVNTEKKIVDLKSSKRAMNQKDIDSDIQFTGYALAHKALTGEYPSGVTIENLVDAPVNPKRVVFETTRAKPQFQKFIEQVNTFLYGTMNGIFLPAQRGEWYCAEDHCPAARTCKYYQFYQRGGGKQALPFWMKFKKKKKEAVNAK